MSVGIAGLEADVPGWFRDGDINFYRLHAARIKGGLIAEIGSFVGRSAISIGKVCKENGTKVYCVDHWLLNLEQVEGGPTACEYITSILKHYGTQSLYDIFQMNVLVKGLKNVLVPFRMESGMAAEKFREEGVRFDMVFIDGSHKYEFVLRDIRLWKGLVKPGGVLAGHDFHPTHPGVLRAVEEELEGYGVWPGSDCWYRYE